jgi:hypothetical protein
MLKRFTLTMVRKYLPGHILISSATMEVLCGTLDIHILKRLVGKHLKGFHIHHDPIKKEKLNEDIK